MVKYLIVKLAIFTIKTINIFLNYFALKETVLKIVWIKTL